MKTSSTPNQPSIKRRSTSFYNEHRTFTYKDTPGADKEANWLPSPNGPIYMVMRLYWPKTGTPSILPPGEGTWKPPGVILEN
jgi:hypothetical protein